MKFLSLLIVFVHLSTTAKFDIAAEIKRFCTEGCPYLKNLDKDPSDKIDVEKVYKKCQTDPKVPKYICEDDFKPDQKTVKILERLTWTQVCKEVCRS